MKEEKQSIFASIIDLMVIKPQYPSAIKADEKSMLKIRNINRLKLILKLILVIPIFSYIGLYVAADIVEGKYLSLLLPIIVWPIVGFILAKI